MSDGVDCEVQGTRYFHRQERSLKSRANCEHFARLESIFPELSDNEVFQISALLHECVYILLLNLKFVVRC